MKTNTETEEILTCPLCGKGTLVESGSGYSCNYFKTIDDKCTFTIYKTYFKKPITPDILKQLVDHGETEIFDDLLTKDDRLFSASLIIKDGTVQPNFKPHYLKHPCPKCGGKIVLNKIGYSCENFFTESKCDFNISYEIGGVKISQSIAETILSGKKTDFFTFLNRHSVPFQSCLRIINNNVAFDSFVCLCPKCGGNIRTGTKAYNCSNQNNEEIKCDFHIWNEMYGRTISPSEVAVLCSHKITDVLNDFSKKNGNEKFSAKIIIDKDFKVKLINE
jgi:predicted RNA-binding Zn-ribbon protein involved in translation (DUF1610 family)